MVSSTQSRDLVEREWEQALETGRHFNDLLIRLRAVALPLVVGAAGVAVGANLHLTWRDVPSWTMAAADGGLGLFLASLLILLRQERGEPNAQVPAGPHTGELVVYWCASVLLLFAAAVILFRNRVEGLHRIDIPVEIPLLALAALIIVTVYLLDRYYYFRLLVGAVNRATALEKILGMGLTATITNTTPPAPARVIITALYFVPILTGIAVLVVFALAARPS